jgi:hypothetical protein
LEGFGADFYFWRRTRPYFFHVGNFRIENDCLFDRACSIFFAEL